MQHSQTNMNPILSLFRLLSPYYKISKTGFFLFGHGVTDKERTNIIIQDLHIEMRYFTRMIDLWEKMGFVFLSMEESMEVVLNRRKINKPWIHLTFDDGYKNNFTILYPYLKSKNIPFTVFLSTRNITEQRRFDNYKIYCSLTHTKNSEGKHLILDPFREQLPVRTDSDTEILSMVKLFKYFSVTDKEAFIEKIERLLSPEEWKLYNELYDTEEVLSFQDIEIMSKDPLVYFGSHGHNHYILSTLSDDQINFEQTESRKIIYQLTGKQPEAYCYPNGRVGLDFRDNIDKLCIQNQYKVSFTTSKKKYIAGVNPLLIPRMPVSYRYMPKLFLDII